MLWFALGDEDLNYVPAICNRSVHRFFLLLFCFVFVFFVLFGVCFVFKTHSGPSTRELVTAKSVCGLCTSCLIFWGVFFLFFFFTFS